MTSAPIIRRATGEDIARCLDIRRRVFVLEQGVPPELEVDAFDAKAAHYLALLDGAPVGTGRVRLLGRTAKVQRVAVLPEARGRGIGAALMRRIAADIPRGDADLVTLGAQESAVPFYAALGYERRGERFMDAGIPHYEMVLRLA